MPAPNRGIPGPIGYCRPIGVPVPGHIRNAASVYRYNAIVFVVDRIAAQSSHGG